MILWPVLGGLIGFFAGKKKLSYSEDVVDIVTFTELAMMAYFAYAVLFKGEVQTLEIKNLMGLGIFTGKEAHEPLPDVFPVYLKCFTWCIFS